jgi:hypothetical protein
VVCTVHMETRSTCFLVEPQNKGRWFVSGLASKPLRWFLISLGLKTDDDGLWVVWPQNLLRWFLAVWPQKPAAMVSSGLDSKPAATVSVSLSSKPVATGFSGLASKPVVPVSPVWPQNWCDGFSLFGLKTGGRFLVWASKPRWWSVSRFGPQNR